MSTTNATQTAIRSLTDAGFERFRTQLASLQSTQTFDSSWLDSDEFGCIVLDSAPPLPLLDADDKLGSARALSDWFDQSGLADRPGIWTDVGLWSWLSAYYLDVLVKKRDGQYVRIGEDARYVLDPKYSRIYRHLLAGPVTLWRSRGAGARFMLHGSLHTSGDNYIELLQAGMTLTAPGPLNAIDTLYWNVDKNAPKRGFANRKQPGTIRRLRDVLLQLSMTYDVTAMSGEQIVALLPPEFDRFRIPSGATT